MAARPRVTPSRRWMVIAGSIIALFGCTKTDRAVSDRVTPDKFYQFVLYDVDGLADSTVGEEALTETPQFAVSPEVTQAIFREVRYESREPLWKGTHLGVIRLRDGSWSRVAISYYGGFFKITGQGGHYITLGESRKELERLLERTLSDVFIPARKERGRTKMRESP